MKENYSDNIIRSYFGKHFSRKGKSLFGRWLRSEDAANQKEETIHELWEESAAQTSDSSTGEDWNALQKYLYTIPVINKQQPLYRNMMKYAAVVGLMTLTASATFLLTYRLKSSKHIEMAEFFVPYGESRLVTLPDSSKVWVDAGSLLVYPDNFSNSDTRTVYLTGKASFTVQKNKEKPFIVKTTRLNVEALGTVFTIDSYPADPYTTATLEEGSVRVDMKEGTMQSSVLKPDEQLVYSHKEHTFSVNTIDASIFGMEREGYLVFDNVSFSQLMATLERKFNVLIHYNSQKYGGQYYNVKFAPDESFEDVLSVLQQLIGINYKVKGNVVFIN